MKDEEFSPENECDNYMSIHRINFPEAEGRGLLGFAPVLKSCGIQETRQGKKCHGDRELGVSENEVTHFLNYDIRRNYDKGQKHP